MKIKLGIFFGGQSVEHEIAVITYSQALTSIDKEKYEVVPIYISKQGLLYTGEDLFELESFKDMDVLLKRCYPVTIVNTGKTWEVTRVHPHLFSKKVLNTQEFQLLIMLHFIVQNILRMKKRFKEKLQKN